MTAGLPDLKGADRLDWYGQHGGIVNNNPNPACHTGVYASHNTLSFLTGDNPMGGPSTGTVTNTRCGVTFDAHAANAIYGNSTTVTPLSLATSFVIKY